MLETALLRGWHTHSCFHRFFIRHRSERCLANRNRCRKPSSTFLQTQELSSELHQEGMGQHMKPVVLALFTKAHILSAAEWVEGGGVRKLCFLRRKLESRWVCGDLLSDAHGASASLPFRSNQLVRRERCAQRLQMEKFSFSLFPLFVVFLHPGPVRSWLSRRVW